MDWVKRNLVFVIGTAVAVGLLLFSGFYLYSNSRKNNEARDQLEAEYNELKRLHNLKPHPGKGDVDNIRVARQQQQQLQAAIQKVAQRLEPIPAIPAVTNVTGERFSSDLRRTIDLLNRRATASSVVVPTNYNFSFEAEKRLVKFAPGSLNRLAVQLGEVAAISEIMFDAKVNKLTGLRRERVSPDDRTGPQTDYLSRASVTNELAVISPYEVSFESFSAELAEVVSGFANSPHGLVIKGLNIQPARTTPAIGSRYGFDETAGYMPATPIYTAPAYPTAPTPEFGGQLGEFGAGGLGGEFGPGGGSQIRRPTFTRPTFGNEQADRYGQPPGAYSQQAYAQAYAQQAAAAYPRAGMAGTAGTGTTQTLIDEHPLSVTLVVEVIKLLPPQQN